MTILRGHFAMMLVVAVPDGLEPAALEEALSVPARALDLVITVRAIEELPDEVAAGTDDGDRWIVSVHGADRPGIVHRVSRLLADAGVNIVDLTTRVIGDADRPVYAMVLEVSLPAGLAPQELEGRLEALAGELGVTCNLHPDEADIL